MRKEKYLSRWLDDLEPKDIKQIEQFSMPWQKTFLYRFYKQLKKQKISKIEVTERVEKNGDKSLLPNGYTLPRNTLTQFTNFKSNDMRAVNVTNLIAVSLALNVSINYLLGIDSCETPENTDINKATGLTNEVIETIKANESLQEKMNFFLLCPEIRGVCEEIDQLYRTRLVFNDILGHFKNELSNGIENAYNKFFRETFALDRTEEKYKEYLYQELPFEKVRFSNTADNIMDVLKDNLSDDLFTQIKLKLEDDNNYDEQHIYDVFIDFIVTFAYDIFEKQYTEEMQMNRISQSFSMLIDEYIKLRIQKFHNSHSIHNHNQ